MNIFLILHHASFRWPYMEMSEFKQPYLLSPLKYFVKDFRIFQTYFLLSNDRRMNVEFLHVSKIALSRLGLLWEHVRTASSSGSY